MSLTREAGFGPEVKRRIILGTYALSSGYYDAYYGQAQKVRTLITRDFTAAFEQVDVLVSPTTPFVAFPFGRAHRRPVPDVPGRPVHASRRTSYGGPAISVPCGLSEGLPVGLQVMAPTMADDRMYRVAAALESDRRHRSPPPGAVRHDSMTTVTAAVRRGRRAVRAGDRPGDPRRAGHRAPRCSAAARPTFGAEPNTQVCPVCLGLPGSLPVANKAAIEATIRIGLALNCSIATWCRFARKNYFYPDMPKNFQISQYDEPLCVDGYLDVEVDGETVRVGIERVHLEEDTGKTLHVGGATGRIHGADRVAGRLQPGRHPAGRDRHQAGPRHRRAAPPRWPGRT